MISDHYTSPLSPPKRGSKTQNGRFPSKIALRLKKVQLTLIRSPLRTLQGAQYEHRTLVPKPQRGGGLKNANCRKFEQ